MQFFLLSFGFVLTTTTAASIHDISQADWKALNQTVNGRLHITRPLALPCYASYNNGTATTSNAPDFSTCSALNSNKGNASLIADHPGGYITANFGACQAQQNAGCPFGQLAGTQLLGTCSQGSVPTYHIEIREPGDVAAGLAFAQQHEIPLVVKNTGHDYKGRSALPNSLALWTHYVQPPIKFSEDFVPDGCSDSVGTTLTYGAGQGFQGIYEAAHANGVMAVGGTSPTVGASGGWVTGGGHSALSPNYGLGVDNVMEMKAVLPNGTFITANRCQNTDLFFALRGGGGGTFGVVMETTSRVYPEVPLQHISILALNLNLINGIEKIVTLLVENTPQWSRDGWGGYMAAGGFGVPFLLLNLITPNLTLSQAEVSMKPILDFAQSLSNLSLSLSVNLTTEPTYHDYFYSSSAQSLSSNGVGSGIAMASRLVPKESFVDPSKKAELISTLTSILTSASNVPAGFLMVPPANYPVPQTDSLSPAWRSSYWHVLFEKSWDPSDPTVNALDAFNQTTTSADILRAITPEGAYQNEGDTYEPNPPASFWGEENYERLLRIKKEVDPGNVLTCHQCVGWDEDDERFACYPKVR